MAGEADTPTEAHQRGVLRAAAVILLFAAAIAIALIAAGAFDPKPNGSLMGVEHPGPQTRIETGEAFTPLAAPWPAQPERFTMRLTAAHAGGELDSGYGLALGGDAGQLVVALSPLGYVTVREEHANVEPLAHMPWQTWPHVRTGTAENEIWLDVAQSGKGAAVTAWVNRELLWSGDVAFWPQEVSLYQTTFGEPATVDFGQVEWFAEP